MTKGNELYNAMERAFTELPKEYEINISMRKDSGCVYLVTPNNKSQHVIEGDGWLAEDIHAAVDKALELEFNK